MNTHSSFWNKRKSGKRLLAKNAKYEYARSSCERSVSEGANSSSNVVYYFNGEAEDDQFEDEKTIHLHDRSATNKLYNQTYIEKEILSGDSIANLALRYGCTVEELKRLNKIFYDQEIHALDKIKIPIKPFSILTEISEKEEEIIDSGHSSPLRDTRTLSIGSNLLSKNGSKNAFLQQMDQDLERIRRSARNYESESSLVEIAERLTCKRFYPLTEQLKINQERFKFSLFVAGALITFFILIPLLHKISQNMDELMVTRLDNASVDETNKMLTEFNSLKATTFTFNEFDPSRRRRAWQILFKKLSESSYSRCHIRCLETIRILSRDKTDLNDVISRDMIDLLLKIAGLVLDEDTLNRTNSQDDYKLMLEAQKSLCNLIFHCTAVQRMCCNSGCIEGIMMRLKTYRDPDLVYEVKFFDMRMLFLLTTVCADVRPKLRNELHGLTYLMEVLDLILKTSAERNYDDARSCNRSRSGRVHDVPYLNDEEADLACEVLKTLFSLTMHVDKNNLDEVRVKKEEEAHFLRMVSILHDILICPTHTKEKREEVQNHTVNLLTNMPAVCYDELLTPLSDGAVGGYDNKDVEYDGQNMEAVVILLDFLDRRLDKPSGSIQEGLPPILTCLCECARSIRTIRKFLRLRVLPPLRDVYNRPEQGETLRNKLCRLLTSPITAVKLLVADFLFILCKESVARLIKYTGYGNAAGLLANRGLMLGGQGKGNYSSESDDSDTEEYREARDRINPVIGCYEEPRLDPMAGMSEEQKEYEAIQLVNLMDKLSRGGMIQPMRVGEDEKPYPVEHILEMRGDVAKNRSDSESD
uniref:LysM domain-containing protein n=1 Tax=Strigamia maritima TaxID=126957 RepID=T1JDW5_STRMM